MSRTGSTLLGGGLVLLGLLLGLAIDEIGSPDPDLGAATQKLVSVHETIRSHYVQPLSPDTLTENAVRGLVSALDPHSAYVDQDRMERVQDTFEGAGAFIPIVSLIGRPAVGPSTRASTVTTWFGPSPGGGWTLGPIHSGSAGENDLRHLWNGSHCPRRPSRHFERTRRAPVRD